MESEHATRATVAEPATPGPPRALARALLLLALPLAWLGPALLPGQRLLPHLPVGLAPLASEYPEAARAAWDRANWSTSDRIFPALSDQVAMRAALARGHLPTWEPNLGLGAPLFAGSMAGGAYPPNLLAYLVGPDRAAAWLAVLALVLAGLGAWLFLARRGLSPGACALGALAYQAGGWGVANLEYFMKVDAALWLPWHLWAVEGLVRGRPRAGAFLALSTGLSFLGGFPPVAVFGLLVAGVWALGRALGLAAPGPAGSPPRPVPVLARAAAWVLVGLAGAGVQLLPTAEASRHSLRQGAAAERLEAGALPPASVLAVVAPDLFGSPLEPPAVDPVAAWVDPDPDRALRANPLEWSTFAGIAACLLAVVALVARPREALAPALLLAAVYAYATATPPASWLYALPGLDLGAPNRALCVAWFLWPWLAALGAQALLERAPRAAAAAAGGAALLAVLGLAMPAAVRADAAQEALEASLAERHDLPPEEVRAVVGADAGARLEGRIDRAGRAWLGTALGLLAALAARRRGPLVAVAAGALVLTVLPTAAGTLERVGAHALWGGAAGAALLAAGAGPLGTLLPLGAVLLGEALGTGAPHVVPRDLGDLPLFPPSEHLDAVAEAAGDGRVLRVDPTLPRGEHVLQLARPSLLQPYGIPDLATWIIFTPRTYGDLVLALDPDSVHGAQVAGLPDPALLDHPLLDLLRATAVLAVEPLEHERLELVHAAPGFHVYRRSGAQPPARVVERVVRSPEPAAVGLLASGAIEGSDAVLLAPDAPDAPRGPGPFRPGEVEVARPAPGRLDVRVTGSSGGWLVMREQFFPGWKATVNGEDAVIQRADHAFRAVAVPPGDALVRTWYEPGSLRVGALASLVGLALVLRGLLRRRPTEAR